MKAYEKALKAVEELKEVARPADDETKKEDEGRDNNRTKLERSGRIDYYNPENQRKQINRIIEQAADDPKTQLDAIKAIQQTQRDDRQAAKDNQIQRFYSPLRCHKCPLYQRRKAKTSPDK